MLISYTDTNVLTMNIPGKGREIRSVQLLPGNNEIEDADWAKLKDHPAVKMMMTGKNRILKELAPPSKDNKKSGKGLAKYGADEAEEIILDTFDKKLLSVWASVEQRQVVKTLIEEQIKTVDGSVQLKDDDDEDDD